MRFLAAGYQNKFTRQTKSAKRDVFALKSEDLAGDL
jgi:hypothetical protein